MNIIFHSKVNFVFLKSDCKISMQKLPVAHMGYLCPSLQWAEYELKGEEKEKDRSGIRCRVRN